MIELLAELRTMAEMLGKMVASGEMTTQRRTRRLKPKCRSLAPMHVLLIPIAVPAAVAAIFALALGGNPVRADAWGAVHAG
jgi:hypothetical protein